MILGILTISILIAASFYYYSYYLTNTSDSQKPSSSKNVPVSTDLNWGGYAVASDFNNPQPVITAISGSWVVPSITPSINDTFSAIWIGIGGTFGNTLIQAGTQQVSVGGHVYYNAWYELLPQNEISIDSMDVSPGDLMTSCIGLIPGSNDIWEINITNLSTEQSFYQEFNYYSSRLSAEWVVERPTVNNILSDLAIFDTIEIAKCQFQINGKNTNLSGASPLKILMTDKIRQQLVDVSDLNKDNSSFQVKFITSY